MHIVAIDVEPGVAEQRAGAVADALGKARAEVAPRLRVPGGGPTVIATFADAEAALDLKSRLDAAGLNGILLRERDIETRNPGHRSVRFELDAHHLRTFTREGQQHQIAYRDIGMLLQTADNRTELGWTTPNPNMSPLEALMVANRYPRKPASAEYVRGTNFQAVRIYVGPRPVLQLRSLDLAFDGLGRALLRTRTANFQRLTDMLREHCPNAVHDARLSSRTRVSQILGPALSADHHLHVATTLIARVVGRASNPFRVEG